mgnify:CR=1 FL=1
MNDQITLDRTGLKHPLYQDIAAGVTGRAERVIVGLNWTLVVGPHGAGLSHTPARGTGGCFSLPDPGNYKGQALASLAAMTQSENVFETAIAIAASNAFHNRYDLSGSQENGLDLIPDGGSDTVIIGRFPGLDQRIPKAKVIEREPGPNDYPESAAEALLPECRHLIITASTMLDGALPRLLALAPQARTILLGPGTPLAPALFHHGIDALSGLVVDDIDGLSQAVIEGGAVRALKRHSHNLSLFKPGP